MSRKLLLSTVLGLGISMQAAGQKYEPRWESLDKRPTPAWFDEGKFGIFIHWGVYSVPAWGPKGKYSEWYWYYLEEGRRAAETAPALSLTMDGKTFQPDSFMTGLIRGWLSPKIETWQFHVRNYGANFKYQDFAPMFKAELFDPDQWAEIFKRSGAKYIVLTSKHHEGFCLWPNAQSWNWNAGDIGPHRDLAGDLTKAVKAKGLKMGFYFSLYEWFNPLYKADPKRYVQEHMLPQLRDLVMRYEPALVWPDGEWEHPPELWRSQEFLAWLFNESPVKDDVAINDRWGKDPSGQGLVRGKHGGFYTTEYGGQEEYASARHKWEECRGMGASFGYNRNEDINDYKPAAEHIWLLVDIVARGGNLLLDIGPTADGRIPVIMQQRLIEIGDWLNINGEAIYGTKPWRQARDGDKVRYTAKGDAIYAITKGWPGPELLLSAPKANGDVAVTMLGHKEPLKARFEGGKLHIEVPPLNMDQVPCRHAYAFRIVGVE